MMRLLLPKIRDLSPLVSQTVIENDAVLIGRWEAKQYLVPYSEALASKLVVMLL